MIRKFKNLNKIQKVILILIIAFLLRETFFADINSFTYNAEYNYKTQTHTSGLNFSENKKNYNPKSTLYQNFNARNRFSISLNSNLIYNVPLKRKGIRCDWIVEEFECNLGLLPLNNTLNYNCKAIGKINVINKKQIKSKLQFICNNSDIKLNLSGKIKIKGFSSIKNNRKIIEKEIIKVIKIYSKKFINTK